MIKIILFLFVIAFVVIAGCTEDSKDDNPRQIILDNDESNINNFNECAEAGNPIMESYPRRCNANGITFIEDIEKDPIPRQDNGETGTLASYFNDQIISKGIDKIGQPIEGFDAYLLKRAFPALKDEDFNDVEALIRDI